MTLGTRIVAGLLCVASILLAVPSLASAEEAGARIRPWSGWWWPKGGNGPHLYDANGPLSKYDQYVQRTYGYNPGTAAAEQRMNFQNGTPVDWAGHCHAWSAASVRTPEPAGGFYRNGIWFSRDDTKALVTKLWDSPNVGQFWWGNRYGFNAATTTQAAYNDIAPAWFDYLIRYYVGQYQYPLIMDIEPDTAIWNFPAFAYRRTATPVAGGESVRMTVWFSRPVQGVHGGADYFTRDYTYTIPTGTLGSWTGSSTTSHPDFAWLPSSRNAVPGLNLREDIVREIVGQNV